MSWLYGQTWLWYLIAFLVGLLLAWLVFVRPAQRRLVSLLSGSADAEAGGTGARSAGTPPATSALRTVAARWSDSCCAVSRPLPGPVAT